MRIPSSRLVAVVLATAVLLTGCTAATGGASAGADVVRLVDTAPVADPRAVTGPSTALLGDATVEPVTGGGQALPVTVVDRQGTEVVVEDTSRILALDLYGSLSRIVVELGLGDSLVGRDVSSDFAEVRDLPLVTQSGHDLSAEAMLALSPTLILTDTTLGPWDAVLQMRDAGVDVVVLDSGRSLETIPQLVGTVADALGVAERGVAVGERIAAEVDAKIAEIAAIAPAAAGDRVRMLFLYVRGQAGVYYLFGTESGADSLIDALGGVDVATELGWTGMRPVTDEALVAADPDLVLMMTKGLESVDGVDGLLEAIPALAQTAAGEHRRVVDMDDTQILSFGPNAAAVLDALAVAVYAPEAE